MYFSSYSVEWLFLAVLLGALIELVDVSSVSVLDSLSDAHGLPLPHRIRFSGTITAIRSSADSLTFDVKNQGVLTCYYRHPPAHLFLFSGDIYTVDASLVQTPRGRLCVVRAMSFDSRFVLPE